MSRWIALSFFVATVAVFTGCGSPAPDNRDSCVEGEACSIGVCRAGVCVPVVDVGEDDVRDTRGEIDEPLPGEGEFGWPCASDLECLSGFCIEVGDSRQCTVRCDGPCPEENWECDSRRNARGDTVEVCAPRADVLCETCTRDLDCERLGDRCVQMIGGRFCGRDCTDLACPDGFECESIDRPDGVFSQCVPTSGTCLPCFDEDGDGYGVGDECLGPDCDDANEHINPGAEEMCDGFDNDCDEVIDEGFAFETDIDNCGACRVACRNETGSVDCVGGACVITSCDEGWWDANDDPEDGCEYFCTETADGVEICDGIDNDCDGLVDEDGAGCELPNAAATCAAAQCVVAECEDGWWDVNRDPTDGCEYECTPSARPVEICDGIDNNCNGRIDEGFDVMRDILHCGECGNVCPLHVGIPACVDGECRIGSCIEGLLDCDGEVENGCEVDPRSDIDHCGRCANRCEGPNADWTCESGSCRVGECLGDYRDCNASTVDGCETNVQTSDLHCGACGVECDLPNATSICAVGECLISVCDEGWVDLDGRHDNGCEYPCSLTNGGVEICDGLDNDCNGVVDEGFDLTSDREHCGRCGNLCFVSRAETVCQAGSCAIDDCANGWDDCNGVYTDGCESNLSTSLNHCGECGNACRDRGAAWTCDNGTCRVTSCVGGFLDCNEIDEDGCEINPRTDPSNCGECGNACELPNAITSCVLSTCRVAACEPGWWDADGDPANGCESLCTPTADPTEICDGIDNDCNGFIDEHIDFDTDVSNCGACDVACTVPNATPACVDGECAVGECWTGWGDCDGDPSNGCEVDLRSSLAHCGTCDRACAGMSANWLCGAGTCLLTSCEGTNLNCNGSAVDGCEVDIFNDPNNCGGCGRTCNLANAVSTCSGGSCAIVECLPGWGNCDGNPLNGCETSLRFNESHCGECSRTCASGAYTAFCDDDRCRVSECPVGRADCNGDIEDGCEQDTATSVDHCGGCDVACEGPNAATFLCASGSCNVLTCDEGYADCDSNGANGCETDTQADLLNCGACGATCAPTGAVGQCVDGACGWSTCRPGFFDLDGDPSNGCEYACISVAGVDLPDMDFRDTNCDGVDGELSLAVFVATNGRAGAPGTMADPLNTIAAGLDRAVSTGRRYLIVAEGTYSEAVTLRSGIGIYGGYRRTAGAWSRHNLNDATTIIGATTTGVLGQNINAATTLQNVRIVSDDATAVGGSSYAVRLINSGNFVTFEGVEVFAGDGRAGASGADGTAGAPGTRGGDGVRGCDGCSGEGWGGAAGTSPCSNAGGAGGRGGHGSSRGASGATGVGDGGGVGASGGSGDGSSLCLFGCGNGGTGGTGGRGRDGVGGLAGPGGSGPGTVSGGLWQGPSGQDGVAGSAGAGGGGGGGGGGSDCCNDDRGGGGGGGGGGGCGGTPGGGGTSGGGSFGVFLDNSSPLILNSTVVAGDGGAGGNGGNIGVGGSGGAGGGGGARADDGGAGGPGGRGGDGGASGCGGGGPGGPAWGVYRANGSAPVLTGNSLNGGVAGSPGQSPCGTTGDFGGGGPVF